MKKFNFLFLSLLFLCLFAFLAGGKRPESTQAEPSIQEEYVPNEVLVKFKKDTARTLVQQGIELVQGKIQTYLGQEITTLEWNPEVIAHRSFLADPDLFRIQVPEFIGTEQAIFLLSLNPNVECAEKNFIGHFFATTPNDDYFYKLWGLNNTGQTGGTGDADIDAPEAWDIHKGSTSIVVAVIDTGIDYNHIDLKANIWTNPGETGGGKETNEVDDDGNGYRDDWHGWNFVDRNNDPMDEAFPEYHGTHVAGTIGAKGNNDEGVVGVCWIVKLMALKAENTGQFIEAIDYATSNGARLSNNSWGVPFSQLLLEAINRAKTNGKLFIAAAGNGNTDNDANPIYPASYDLDNIISVLATDHFDTKSWYSNFGPYSVDVGAPGGTDPFPTDNTRNIYSTTWNDEYQYMSGTSMASPYVAGEAALIWAHRPSLSWWQVKNIIMTSVDPKGSLWGKVGSGGRINAYNALTKPTPNLPAAPSNFGATGYGCDIKLFWKDNSNNEDGFEIYRKDGYVFSLIDTTDPNVREYWDRGLLPGRYYYYIRAFNEYGNSQKTPQQGARAYECQ